jgi:MFS family permease
MMTGWKSLRYRFRLAEDDLLRDSVYRRLWTSSLISSFGGQVTVLALPLTAVVLLHSTPSQMGWLTTMGLLPFVLFSLPAGVWLDRVRKLPVYVAGKLLMALVIGSVPLAWAMDWLSLPWLYVGAFLIGIILVTAESAAQIILTMVVARERLVEAHAKNALATSSAQVAGPGLAGALIRVLGAPLALLLDAAMLVFSVAILLGVRVDEARRSRPVGGFWADLKEGLLFVRNNRLLLTMAACVGVWQVGHQAATVVQILFATRILGLSEQEVGLSYIALGIGTVLASLMGDRISKRIGPGPSLALGFAATALGWSLLAIMPAGPLGVATFALMLILVGLGAVLVFINFISLRQAITPERLLGRMTSTMRWLILLPAVPGALIGGWLGEHLGLRVSLGFAGVICALVSVVTWRLPALRTTRSLPSTVAVSRTEALEDATT